MQKLTEEQIINLKNSDRLNALIAIEIKGWHKVPRKETAPDCPFVWENAEGSFKECSCQFSPSSNIQQAWQLISELRKQYWCFEIYIADGCRVVMELLKTPPIRIELASRSSGETAFDGLPEAICKAVLVAKLRLENSK